MTLPTASRRDTTRPLVVPNASATLFGVTKTLATVGMVTTTAAVSAWPSDVAITDVSPAETATRIPLAETVATVVLEIDQAIPRSSWLPLLSLIVAARNSDSPTVRAIERLAIRTVATGAAKTSTVATAATVPIDARTAAVPTDTPVTRPSNVTLTIVGLALNHWLMLSWRVAPNRSRTTARSWPCSATSRRRSAGSSVIVAGACVPTSRETESATPSDSATIMVRPGAKLTARPLWSRVATERSELFSWTARPARGLPAES